MLQRPPHLQTRQISGRVFSEPITIIRMVGSRNRLGEYVEEESRQKTLCATAPATGRLTDLLRELTEGGVQLNEMRLFWTVEDLNPVVEGNNAGDLLEYRGQRYRVHLSERWGGFSQSMGKREEAQGSPTTGRST